MRSTGWVEDTGVGPGVILLIGTPGVGKSTLAKLLLEKHPECVLLNTGERLRDMGLLDEHLLQPSAAGLANIQIAARQLLEQACCTLKLGHDKSSQVPDQTHRSVLILEYVKGTDNAYTLAEVLLEHDIPLLQVLYIPNKITRLLRQAGNPSSLSDTSFKDSLTWDRTHQVTERQGKWQSHAGRILEFFSSSGVLVEVSNPDDKNLPTLAGGLLGYAVGKDADPIWLTRAAWFPPSGMWELQAAVPSTVNMEQRPDRNHCGLFKFCRVVVPAIPARRLLFQAIQPVVSHGRLVVSVAERERVVAEAESCTGLRPLVHSIPVPSLAVNSEVRAAWVAWPGRYTVSRKCDGTRYLLIVASDRTVYLLNRIGTLYAYPVARLPKSPAVAVGKASEELSWCAINRSAASSASSSHVCTDAEQLPTLSVASASSTPLPVGTVLDGELVWVGGRGFFLAFDAVSVGAKRTWQMLLDERLAAIAALGLPEADTHLPLYQAFVAAANTSNISTPPTVPGQCSANLFSQFRTGQAGVTPQLSKKQQAPPAGQDTITILSKAHHSVSFSSLQALQDSLLSCAYPVDGLVFTPKDFPYALGMTDLLMKWQPYAQVAADLTGQQLQQQAPQSFPCANLETLDPALVYECRFTVEAGGMWVPVSVRWDKYQGNAAPTLDRITHSQKHRESLGHSQICAVTAKMKTEVPSLAPATPGDQALLHMAQRQHPARALPFEELLSLVMEAVGNGVVERNIELCTGLEVFNYKNVKQLRSTGLASSFAAAENVSRGLILHPPSQTVVATPFPRFSDASSINTCDNCSQYCNSQDLKLTFSKDSQPKPCSVCGCLSAVDEDVDRICWCKTCYGAGRSCKTFPSVVKLCPSCQVQNVDEACTSMDRILEQPLISSVSEGPASKSVGSADDVAADSPAADSFAAELGVLASSNTPTSVSDDIFAPKSCNPLYGNSPVRLSLKIDGSLAIVFLWEGKLRASTRRRMDSEQAVWAEGWLQAHAAVSEFHPGWTYLFEVVCAVNTLVVAYPFEGLVLLEAVSPTGFQLASREERYALAQRLHVIAVPELVGIASQILPFVVKDSGAGVRNVSHLATATVGASASAVAAAAAAAAAADALAAADAQSADRAWSKSFTSPTSEGWVMRCADGSLQKLVKDSFRQLHSRAQWLHPLAVWESLYRGTMPKSVLMDGLPPHMRSELQMILGAYEQAFDGVLAELKRPRSTLSQELQQRVPSPALEPCPDIATVSTPVVVGVDMPEQTADVAAAASQIAKLTLLGSCSTGIDETQCSGLVQRDSQAADKPASLPAGETPADKADLYNSVPFQKAKAYFDGPANKATNPLYPAQSLQKFSFSTAVHMRCLILDCIRPATNGKMPGYLPSANFAQSWSKGWAAGPKVGRFSPNKPFADALPQTVLSDIMGSLGGVDVARASTVCKLWSETCHSLSDFAERCAEGKKQVEKEKEERFEHEEAFGPTDYYEDRGDYEYGDWDDDVASF